MIDSNKPYYPTNYAEDDRAMDIIERFREDPKGKGIVGATIEIVGGFFGTLISTFSTNAGLALSGEAFHRADMVGGYAMSLDRSREIVFQINEEVAELKKQLDATTDPLERTDVLKKLLLKKEDLEKTRAHLVQVRCSTLTNMRGHFGERKNITESEHALIEDIRREHQAGLNQFDSINAELETVRNEMAANKCQKWVLRGPVDYSEPTREQLEHHFDLAEHPWKRQGVMAFIQRHINLDNIDAEALQRALNGISGMIGRSGAEMTAGDLHQLIGAMERALESKPDANGSLAETLVALKGLVANAVLEHPDEIRRVISLATFLFVGSVTGGVDGMLTASFAKVVTDRILSNFLPTPDPTKAESSFSKLLRVAEAGVFLASGNVLALGAYAVAEVAHYQLPEMAQTTLVFGVTSLGMGLPVPVAAAATAMIEHPHLTISLARRIPGLIRLLCNPRQIPGAIASSLRDQGRKIRLAAQEKRYGEVAQRVAVLALPTLMALALIVHAVMPITLGFTASVLFSTAMMIAGLSTILALVTLLRDSEARKKAAMVRALEGWRTAYNQHFPNVEQRDAAVVAVFEEIEAKIRNEETVDKRVFLELLQKHIPAFQERSLEELEEALAKVAADMQPALIEQST